MYVHESCLVLGMELGSPALQTYSLLSEPLWVWACFIYSVFPTKSLSFCLHKLSLILATIELLWQNNVGKAPAAAAAKSLQPCLTLCNPIDAAHQAPRSLGFFRQEHWSGLTFSSPMHGTEKWKWSRSVASNSSRPHGLQPTRLLLPWDFPGKVLEWLPLPSPVKHVAHSNWQLIKTTVYTFFRAVVCMCNIFSFPGGFLSLPHMQTEQ